MKSPYRFIVEPLKGKYNTTKNVSGKTLFLTSSIEDAKYVSREARVISVPMFYDSDINVGDIVIIHHNIFRDFYNQNGKVSSSNNHIKFEGRDMFLVLPELVYLYKSGSEWMPNDDYCFIRPLSGIDKWKHIYKKQELIGEVVYSNKLKKGLIIGFTPDSEYEFNIDGEVLYRMKHSDICIEYEGIK